MTTTLKPSLTLNEERWFMPAIASVIMGTCTLPLDMLKVQLQAERTDYEGKTILELIALIIEERGFSGMFAGYSGLVLAQIFYATPRFSFYKLSKNFYVYMKSEYSFMKKWPETDSFVIRVLRGAGGGALAGLIANPPTLIMLRMQNDLKQPPENRRNYRHVFHACVVIVREEGVLSLMTGTVTCMFRAIGMAIGQISIYEHVKHLVMHLTGFGNTIPIHIFSACVAGAAATVLTNPLDVMKTRVMTAEPGKYKGIWDIVVSIAKEGICTFYKGMTLAFVRQILNTVILWVTLEQLKIYWGIPPEEKSTTSTAVLTTVFTTLSKDTMPPP